jgi:hypothetical protein
LTRFSALLAVIACDKRKAFAQGSESDEAIHLSSSWPLWIASLAPAMTKLAVPFFVGDVIVFGYATAPSRSIDSSNALLPSAIRWR